LIEWLKDIGYDDRQIKEIQDTVKSDDVKKQIEKHIKIVEDKIRTIKIPTIIFNGRRYDRVIGPEKLR
jgi:ferritin-like metal-binding protein YciE